VHAVAVWKNQFATPFSKRGAPIHAVVAAQKFGKRRRHFFFNCTHVYSTQLSGWIAGYMDRSDAPHYGHNPFVNYGDIMYFNTYFIVLLLIYRFTQHANIGFQDA
jgi:hypothetical protein